MQHPIKAGIELKTDLFKHTDFFVAGINFKNSNEEVRGTYHVSTTAYKRIIEKAKKEGINEAFVVSTCNRTEIYGFASSANQLAKILCDHVPGDLSTFIEKAYLYKNEKAVKHFFYMVSGLDSQILGDYEIVGQVKSAVEIAKSNSLLGAYTMRMINTALAASKEVKNRTCLSSGTVSVSFANVQFLNEQINQEDQRVMNVLVIGAGSMGKNTCKNLRNYCKFKSITLINRTVEKAQSLAEQLEINYGAFDELSFYTDQSSVIIAATGSDDYVVTPDMISQDSPQWLVDLSLPANIDPKINLISNKQLISLDELSKIKDNTLDQRKSQLPKAEKIIRKHLHEFAIWRKKRKHAPFLKNVKETLVELDNSQRIFHTKPGELPRTKVNMAVRHVAKKVQTDDNYGCLCLRAINNFISPQL